MSAVRGNLLKIPFYVIASIIYLLSSSHSIAADSQTESGESIIQRHLENHPFPFQLVQMEMKQTTSGETDKEHQILAIYHTFEDGTHGYLLRILAPKEVAGAGILMKDQLQGQASQYLFLPEFGRTQRLRRGSGPISFMGSDFTYDDLLREIPATQNYQRLPDQTIEDELCYVVRATDRLQKTWKAYHHRDLFISQKENRLVKIDFFEDESTLEKSLTLTDFQAPSNSASSYPYKAVMVAKDDSSKTELTVLGMASGIELSEELFTPSSLSNLSNEQVEAWIEQLPN